MPLIVTPMTFRIAASSAGARSGAPEPAEELHLDGRQRVDVRVAQVDRPRERGVAGEQAVAAGDQQQHAHGPRVLGLDHAPDRGRLGALGEVGVAAEGPEVGLGQRQLGVVEHRREERPAAVEAGEVVDDLLAAALGDRLERRPEAVPAGQVRPRLRPREHPRDRAQRRRRPSTVAAVGAARPAPPGRADGRDPSPRPAMRSIGVAARKNAGERRPLDQRPVGRARDRGQLGHRRPADRRGLLGRALVLRRRREQRGRRDLLEVALGDRRRRA